MTRERQLVGAFVEMADTLVVDFDVAELLHQLADHCVELLEAAAAGLMLADERNTLHIVAASSERTRLLELFQLQNHQGPCLDCFDSGEPVRVPDLAAAAERWPVFADHAQEQGFASVHALPLRLRSTIIGALNLFGTTPTPMSEADLKVAQGLADVATIGILQERAIRRGSTLTEQLQHALNSRVIIEQAKGVLAGRESIDVDEAFTRIRSYARSNNLRLTDLAHAIATGQHSARLSV
ncbi:GAF and ANTAR domain-containing protein [Allosalinactinospora lopnorensis]|uniref:GAF and ANTAR domain-containing protein n=1 Tax=Allosalinactinospora lopnorensis TaxID=1352348 RepID=UPI000A8204A6|nr:GAF and ANTAR domain-containing protein [Allosalinactinospora lopnorensis]